MAVNPTYPGVYIQEVSSGVRTIVGVSTSIAVFVGRTQRGPGDKPIRCQNMTEFERVFGDDSSVSDVARSVRLFFANGGTDCFVVRIARDGSCASVVLKNEVGAETLKLTAKSWGVCGSKIRVAVTYDTPRPESTFNLELFRWEVDSKGRHVAKDREFYRDLTMDDRSPNYAPTFLTQKSALVSAKDIKVPAVPGFSLAMRPIPSEEADIRSDIATFFGTGGSANCFRLSVGGNPPVDVDLKSIGQPSDETTFPSADFPTNVARVISEKITGALGAQGLVDPSATCEFVRPAGEKYRLMVSSTKTEDIVITSASSSDAATALMWGHEHGGLEVGAHANRRPAPTGATFNASNPLKVIEFAEPDNEFSDINICEILEDGESARESVDLATNAATTGATGDVRAKLRAIRDAINNFRSANRKKFEWEAHLWGYRLAILPTGGSDNRILSEQPLVDSPPSNWFTENVRYFSLGTGGANGLQTPGSSGSDGTSPKEDEYRDAYDIIDAELDLFNLLVLPRDHGANGTAQETLWGDASAFCQKRRAFLLMDPPEGWVDYKKPSGDDGIEKLRIGLVKDHAALFFPNVMVRENGLQQEVGPSGAIAGLCARIDSARGVWKAPSGTEATLRGICGLKLALSDSQNGALNPLGINCLRAFPEGIVNWGARTMDGDDMFASEYKYIPIRRLALFIEESLYRGLRWVVFEPNDEPLWTQIRMNVGSFLHGLFRQGAFQGKTPDESYFVKCDSETTPQPDRDLGIVNIHVGFAPLKPAEFVILHIEQMAGQLNA